MANEHIEGRVGIAPPPGAPMEPSQPLRADAGTIIDIDGVAHRPIDKARAHERELAPLTYKDSIATAAAELAGTAVPGVVQAPSAVVAAVAPVKAAVVQPSVSRAPDPTQPAASNTDSPARGRPGTAHSPHRERAPLTVEGGFGVGTGEYFAIDGVEMKACLNQLLEDVLGQAENDHRVAGMAGLTTAEVSLRAVLLADTEDQTVTMDRGGVNSNTQGDLVALITAVCDALHTDLQSDMRIQMSWAYPSYGAILTLTVKAHAADPGFTIVKHRREFNEAGDLETPPDALREELALPIPGRQIVVQGALGAISSDVRA
jgi:hypothetical protein